MYIMRLIAPSVISKINIIPQHISGILCLFMTKPTLPMPFCSAQLEHLGMSKMVQLSKETASMSRTDCHLTPAPRDCHETSSLPLDHPSQAKSQKFRFHRKRDLKFHLVTLFLFTKSDFKTVVFPQSIFAIAVALSGAATSSGSHQTPEILAVLSRVPHMVAWIWIHLLVEDIANQRQAQSVAEDAANKPWRPLPSGRLSQDEALALLRASVPAVAAVSLLLGAFAPSAAFTTLVWLYNDLEGSSAGPVLRNVVNAAGLCCLGWGGHTVLASDLNEQISLSLDWRLKWIIVTAAVVATTVHAQDMPDVKGDLARQRRTFPLVYGETAARWSLAVLVVLWSVILPVFCNVQIPIVRWLPVGVGSCISVLTTLYQHESSDRLVWNLWCFWVAGLYLLPLFGQVP